MAENKDDSDRPPQGTGQIGNRPRPRVPFLDEVSYDMLVKSIAREAKEQIDLDSMKIYKTMGVVFSVTAVALVSAITGAATFGFSTLTSSLTQHTENTIDRKAPIFVSQAIEKEFPSLKQEITQLALLAVNEAVENKISFAEEKLTQINNRARLKEMLTEMGNKGSFSDQEMNNAVATLRTLSPDARSNPDFVNVLEKLLDYQAGAGRMDMALNLYGEYEDIAAGHQGIIWTMALTSGKQAISFEADPAGLSDGPLLKDWTNVYEQALKFSNLARNANLPEIPLVSDLVIACMLDRPNNELQALLARVDDLTESEFGKTLSIAEDYAKPSEVDSTSGSARRAQKRLKDCATRIDGTNLSNRSNILLETMGKEVI